MAVSHGKNSVCFVSFSYNADHQTTMYGMFNELNKQYNVATIGASNPKAANAQHSRLNHYVDCPTRPGLAKGTFNVKRILQTAELIKLAGCNIVYFESVHIWNLFLILILGNKFTYYSTIHDVVPHDGSKAVFYCQKLLCKFSDYVVIKSDCFADQAVSLYGIEESKIKIIEVWRDYPERIPKRNKGKCLFFGRLRRYKGLETMAEIIRRLPDVEFEIVGQPDEDASRLLDSLKFLPNVEIEGREVDNGEMEDAFRSASWVLLPYSSASQSGVIIDAYRYSTPVIGYNVGAIAGQISNEHSGFLIDCNDLEGFVSKVRDAVNMDECKYAEMSLCAYEFGKKKYDTSLRSAEFARKLGLARK